MSKWKKVKLGEILQIKKGDYITKKDAREGIYPVILGGKEPAYYIDKYNHTGKAIVVSRSGASAGFVSFWNEPIFVTDGFLIEPKENITFEFLYYALKSKQALLHNAQKGAAIPHVTPLLISDIDFLLPNEKSRHRIATILSRYDSLIENYQKQIKLLEEAARRLYKEWFVDLHFPGHENTKIVDGVPEGWEKTDINRVLTFHRGYDLTHKEFVDGPYPVVGSTSIIGNHNKYKIEGPGIVTGRSGSLGIYQLIWENFWPHNTSLYISDFKGHDVSYIYCMLKTVDFTSLNSGGAIPSLNRNTLSNISVLEPTMVLQESFSKEVTPMFKRQKMLQSQIRLLTEARDRLLPKLMSGKINVEC